MREIFNFSAGPAMLPEEVLIRAQEELVDWQGTGMSIMEMSHRSKEFLQVSEQTEQLVRELLAVPTNYRVLFLAGGATSQFAMVPMNLLQDKQVAAYFNTGQWSKKALQEAQLYCQVEVIGTSHEVDGLQCLPDLEKFELPAQAAYVHYCANETIAGIEFPQAPELPGDLPLVTDMTSSLFSKPCDIAKHGLIYASAQKNFGHAGITLVIIREDLIGHALPNTPSLFNYQKEVEQHSMLNTPATYSWYFAGLMLQWIKQQGGVQAMDQQSRNKSQKIYQLIDQSDFYINKIHPQYRSRLNIPFTLHDPSLDKDFLQQAKQAGLVNLAGHRSVGGMRASMYVGMPEQGVTRLAEFMQDFEKRCA